MGLEADHHLHIAPRSKMCGAIALLAHVLITCLNPLMPNDHYMGRSAQLTSRRCILYIYSTNKHTEYFKHAA